MWDWTLNWGRIRSDLIVGSCPRTPEDIDAIRSQTGATALLSLQTEACREPYAIEWEALRAYGEQHELAMVNTPMLDFDASDQRRQLPQAVRNLHDLLVARHTVYLHDTSGVSRAPLTALAYLTFVEMQMPDIAMATILSGLPGAQPSWEAYEGCRTDLLEILREYVMVRAYYLSQEDPDNRPEAHWLRAEREMIRNTFINDRAVPRWRLDPNRSGTETPQ